MGSGAEFTQTTLAGNLRRFVRSGPQSVDVAYCADADGRRVFRCSGGDQPPSLWEGTGHSPFEGGLLAPQLLPRCLKQPVRHGPARRLGGSAYPLGLVLRDE